MKIATYVLQKEKERNGNTCVTDDAKIEEEAKKEKNNEETASGSKKSEEEVDEASESKNEGDIAIEDPHQPDAKEEGRSEVGKAVEGEEGEETEDAINFFFGF